MMIGVLVLAATPARATNDELWSQQWNVRKARLDTAWITNTGAGVKIAILDTGVDLQHEDLVAKLDPGRDFVDNDATPQDVHGHGTFVAGIAAAATNNGKGIAGAAPAARIVPLRIADSNGNSVGDAIANAMEWAVDVGGAKVINLSFGVDQICSTIEDPPVPLPQPCAPAGPLALVPGFDDSIHYAFAQGALIVVAAGNGGAGLCGYPAFSAFVLCVGSSDSADVIAPSSNHGVRLDVLAPGVGITSTYYKPGGNHTSYGTGGGTSFATPLVAGIGALLMSMGATNVEAMHYIRCTADDLGPVGYDLTYGWGRVNAAAAVSAFKAGAICW